jgi:enamine deaminase RidA (YjgF/YER057c/UK114 family)
MQRQNIASGSPWEDIVGYSRAVRVGNIIEVAGTTASENGIVQGLNDYYAQTKFIFTKIDGILKSAGSSMNEVVRTRIFVCDISQWEQVAKAHHEYFGKIKPVATMVEVSRLISPDLLVEIEVTAISES